MNPTTRLRRIVEPAVAGELDQMIRAGDDRGEGMVDWRQLSRPPEVML